MSAIRILLVEDNPADIELVQEALTSIQLEHDLKVATDFEQASNYVQGLRQEARPDILLLDLNLPKGSGLDILRLFRSRPDCERIPVIVVSSSDSPRDRNAVATFDAVRYFKKPLDFQEFLKLGPLVLHSLQPQG